MSDIPTRLRTCSFHNSGCMDIREVGANEIERLEGDVKHWKSCHKASMEHTAERVREIDVKDERIVQLQTERDEARANAEKYWNGLEAAIDILLHRAVLPNNVDLEPLRAVLAEKPEPTAPSQEADNTFCRDENCLNRLLGPDEIYCAFHKTGR